VCQVLTNIFSAHMDVEHWKDPEVFRPERFIGEDGQLTGTEHMIPFSLGRIILQCEL
jgi:cytochrome P450